jgi:hypothetical protein
VPEDFEECIVLKKPGSKKQNTIKKTFDFLSKFLLAIKRIPVLRSFFQ